MSTAIVLNALPRTLLGTGGARAVRREGMVPGIIYGNKIEPEMISLVIKDLTNECLQPGFFSKLYAIAMNGKEQPVLAKAVQFHPVTDHPVHVDFIRVNKDAKIHVFVPIVFINEDKAPGIKGGGVLNIVHHTLEVICPVDSIPEKLTVDLTGRELGQTIHIDALNLPQGVVPAHAERDNTIATIVAPSQAEEETPAAAAPATS